MDYIKFRSNNRTYYGKLGTFHIQRNYEIVDNPGGNFLPIYLGNYTKPMDVEFELFVDGSFVVYIYGAHLCDIYLERFHYEFSATVYNLRINSSETVYLYKSPNETKLPPGTYKLVKGTFTAYYMPSMFA